MGRNPWADSGPCTINPQGGRALRHGFFSHAKKAIAVPPSPLSIWRLSSEDEPRRLHRASDMFNDIWISRKNAIGLAITLMVATMVIAVGAGYAVIIAEDHDRSLTTVNEYDPHA